MGKDNTIVWQVHYSKLHSLMIIEHQTFAMPSFLQKTRGSRSSQLSTAILTKYYDA